MPKLRVFSSLTLFIGLLVFVGSCREGKDNLNSSANEFDYGKDVGEVLIGPTTANKEITLDEPLTLSNGVTLPPGTIISKIDKDPSTLNYQLPEGYLATGTSNASGRTLETMFGSITCTCTSGTGCSPFVASGVGGKSEGCAMARNCKRCTAERGAREGVLRVGSENDWVEAHGIDILRLSDGIHFITDKAALDTLQNPSSSLLDIDRVVNAVNEFAAAYQLDNLDKVRKARSSAELPDGYIYLPISVYGRIFKIPVQASLVLVSNPLLNDFAPKSPNARVAEESCSCRSGTGGCTLSSKNVVLGRAVWCEAGRCQSCRLSY